MIEMKDSGYFWIGKIPKGWEAPPIKFLLTSENDSIKVGPFGSQLSGSDFTDEGYWVYNQRSVIDKNFSDNTVFIGQEKFDAMRGFHVRSGDILITTRGTIGRICQVPTTFEPGIIHPCIIKFRVNEARINYEFLERVINDSDLVRTQLLYKSNATTINVIYSETLKNIVIPIPPMNIQLKIVDYLRPICAELDNIIAKTRTSIDEYKKLKQAIITQAVTQGVRSNRKMKDSGSVWFGSIPLEWDMKKIKYIFRIKKNIAGEEGYTVLSITQRGIVPKDISKNEGQLAESYANYQLVDPGDFAMNHMDLLTGWVDISKYSGVTSPDYRVFSLINDENNYSQYYLYLMQMCYTNRIFYGLGQGVSGLGRWRLQADKFLNFAVVVPPLNEQMEIAEYLDNKISELDGLIQKKEEYMGEIENYKKSLIYEYVTGKKRV